MQLRTFYPRRAAVLYAGLALCAAAPLAQAQPAQPRATLWLQHHIRAGDTLEQLARHYLGDAQLWPALQAHNRVANPRQLRPGSTLEIPLHLLPSASASIDHVQGSATRLRQGQALPVQAHMPLQEGDQLHVAPQAYVTVRLADGSQVHVQADSQLQLQQLRRRGRSGSAQSVLQLQQGGVDVRVPSPADAQRRLEILTPVATTSVRGTHFDVQLAADGSTSAAVLQGQVAMQAQGTTTATAAPHTQLLSAHTGMAVNAQGQPSAVQPLLPPPDIAQLPARHEDAQWLLLPLPDNAHAQGWRVQVSANAQGQQVLRQGLFTAPLARFAAVPDGHYWVQLRAVDGHGISGLPARAPLQVKAHPVAPLAQTPAGAQLVQGEDRWQCTPVDGAVRYQHQIVALAPGPATAQASDFAQPLYSAETEGLCDLPPPPLPPGHYAWRAASVRLLDNVSDTGPFSAIQPFHITARPAAPRAEDLQLQTQGGISQLHWPGEPGQRFVLQALPQPDSSTPALQLWLQQPHWHAQGLPPGTWYVRIQVQDPSGLLSAWSPPRSVQVRALVRDGFDQPIGTGSALGLEHR